MIALTAGKTIEILLGGAVTAHQLEVVTSWTDVDPAASPQVVSPGGNDLVTADGTPVTAVPAPAGTVARGVDHLSVFNADTVAATATAQLNNGSALRRLARATLQPGESLTYSGRMGWLTLDAEGAVKSTGQAVLLAGSPVVGGAAFAVLREDAGQLLAADAGLTFAGGQLTITQAGISSTITQAGATTVINDATTVQLTIAGAPMVTVTATQIQLGNSYLVVTTTGLVIGTVPYTWPGANAAGVLTNNGSGGLTWTVPAGGVAIGDAIGSGTANCVLFVSAAGNLAQDASFTYGAGSQMLTVPTLAVTTGFGAFGAPPVSQPGATGSTSGFAAGSGAAVTVDSTFTGLSGTTAYTINDLVAAWKSLGWIAP